MIRLPLLLLAVLFLTFGNAYGQYPSVECERIWLQDPELEEKFEFFEIYEIDSRELADLVQREGQVHAFTLALAGEELKFEIYPSNLLAPDYILQTPGEKGTTKMKAPDHRAFRGMVVNPGGGIVSLTVDDGFLYGFFEWDRGTYFIEPVGFLSDQAIRGQDRYVVYEKGDIRPVPHVRCGAMDLEENIQYLEHREERGSHMDTRRVDECYILEYAIASDFSMFSHYGSVTAVENRNIGVMNNVQNNYAGEFDDDIEIQIVTQWISDCSTCDPWPSGNSSSNLLSSFRSWGNGGGFGVGFDDAGLWSRRDFDGPDNPTIGLAYLNAICNNKRYHVLEDFTTNADLLRVLTAHEMGHNFSAEHDMDLGFIMSISVSSTSTWSAQSKGDISAYIANRASLPNCFDNCQPPVPPEPDFDVLNPVVCEGGTVYFYDRSTPAADTWDWTFDGGTPGSSEDQNPVVTYDLPGTYGVTLEVSNDAGSNFEVFNGVVTVGSGGQDIVLYEDFDNGINWQVENPDGSFTWEAVTAGGMNTGEGVARVDNFNYQQVGQRDGMISPTFSLQGRLTGMLRIEYAYARFNQNFTDSMIVYLSTDGGQSFPIRLFQAAENGSGNFATHTAETSQFVPAVPSDWCFGGGFGADCIDIDLSDYSGEANLAIKIENYNGFGNNLYVDRVYVAASCFTVDPPIADFSADPTTGCLPLVVDFFDLSSGEIDSWNWTFEGGDPEFSSEQNPVVIYLNPGTYSVTLEVFNAGGTDEIVFDQYIEVLDLPVAGFDIMQDGNQVTFFNISDDALTYEWDFGDGSTSSQENPLHIYQEDGTYIVTLTAENDCGEATATDTVVVDIQVSAAFTADVSTGCAPLEIQFTDQSSDNATSWQWTFEGGDPATSGEQNPLVIYEDPGSYGVTLISSNGFSSDTLYMPDMVTVYEETVASFEDSLVSNTAYLIDESQNADSLLWDFGDGQQSGESEPSHTYEDDGTYIVSLVAFNQCGTDTAIAELDISFVPVAVIGANAQVGCEPLSVQFTDSSSINADASQWYFEGGNPASSTESEPVVLYTQPGMYSVTLIVSNSTGSDTSQWLEEINVLPLPSAGYTYEQAGTVLEFTNESQNADQYEWIYGDGSTGNESDPAHDYGMDGTFTVTLIAFNGCTSDTLTMEITIGNPPLASFSADRVEVCRGESIAFVNESSPNATTYEWTFEGGNPSQSTDPAPVVTYSNAGTYDVEMTASNDFGTHTVTMTDYVTVLPDPLADFDFTIDGQEISFINQSIRYESLGWDFGDGNFSSDEEPVHVYMEEGVYDVRLTVYGICDTVSLTRVVNTTTMPLADFEVDQRDGCAPFVVQFSDQSSGLVDNRSWNFPGGDPESSNEQNPVVTYRHAGMFSVSLMVSNSSGSNNNIKDRYIRVGDVPAADFTFDQDGELVDLENLSIDADTYIWYFGNDSTSADANPTARYETSGEYEIVLVATNECGNDTALAEVTVTLDALPDIRKFNDIRLYPNPARDVLVLEIGGDDTGSLEWQIIDLAGKIVDHGSFYKQTGSSRVNISVDDLPQAAFFMEITSRNRRHQSKFFKY